MVATGLVVVAAVLVPAVPAGAAVQGVAATAAATPSQQPCADPGPAPTGVTASAVLVPPDRVQAHLTWTPLPRPEGCSDGTTEIEQVSPPGPTIRASLSAGQVTIDDLDTLTAYTWRLRFVSGTVSEWATVSVPKVLPLDYCMALPVPRVISAVATSPTTVHLEWGELRYPAECGGEVTVTNETTGTSVRVGPQQTGVTVTGVAPGSRNVWVVTFLLELGRVTVTQPGDPASTCTAAARVDSSWDAGLGLTVTVRNTGAARLAAWEVRWPLPSGTRVLTVWNATGRTGTDGVFTATPAAWNSALAPGASTTFGLVAARTGPSSAVPQLTCTGRPAA